MRSILRACVCTAVLCLPAAADLYNHKIMLIGDKGAALGGAFTGLADDATATFYNPAGLTQTKNIKLDVSAQVVQYQKQKIGIAQGTDIPYNSFNFSPTITAFSQRMGKWAYGFSIVTPQNDLFTGEQTLDASYRDTLPNQRCYETADNPPPCYTKLDLSYYDVSKTTLIGPSGAMKFSDNISLGFTLYGIYYTELQKTAYGGFDANYVGGNQSDLSRFHESLVTRSVNSVGLGGTGMFGILVRMNQGFSFGVNASPGSLVWVNRTEEQRVEEIITDSLAQPTTASPINTTAEVYSISKKEKHVETSAPSLSLGVSWNPFAPLMIAAQTDYYLGSIYSYTGYTPDAGANPRSGFETLTPLQKTYTIEKNSVVDFSGGIEYQVLKGYSIALSGYTDYSQGPDDSRPASWDENIDYFGFTASLGMDKDLTESRFGVNMGYGDASMTHFQWTKTSGGQPILQRTDDGDIARPRQNFKAYNFGIFLSSTLKI